MIARLLSPVTALVLASLLGAAAGPAWFWTKASAVATKALAARNAVVAEEQSKVDVRRAHGWDFWTVEMEGLSTELKEEREVLRKKSDAMDQRETRLVAERQDLDRVRTEIEGMRREIDERAIAIKADERTNLKSLAKTYSTLTPLAAVAIVREMDDTTLVKILYLMKPDDVGHIFEQMAITPTPDGTLAHRAALLSDRIRLMRSSPSPGTTP
jgi:flagellar motility protein MotE (MotC chaperone)